MKYSLVILFNFLLLITTLNSFGQSDSTTVLSEVVVTAYQSNRSIDLVPASIGVIDSKILNRFSNTSFLPAVNTIPGVRMEERSPGSYRLSVRGSLLRSPFGIRNVKFYWNGLPLTDGGGNTYFNLLDINSVNKIEVIKGPGASVYGAGTGGVVLLDSRADSTTQHFNYSMIGGSFGLLKFQGDGTILSTKKSNVNIGSSYQRADGYRDHTQMKRFSSHLDWAYQLNENNAIATTVFATNLFYETPGGLNKTQFEEDPSQARPATATLPGAEEQKASVKNISTYVGSMFTHEWSNQWQTKVGAFTSLTAFKNPAIRNYEKRDERNIGARTETVGNFMTGDVKWRITVGGEYQWFVSPVDVFDNDEGKTGTLQYSDKLWSSSGLVFSQAEMELPNQVHLTVGVSANFLRYKFIRTSDSPEILQRMQFNPDFFPRIAILKRFNAISVFGSVSSGFSPPSLAEVRPSTGTFNKNLKAESGINFEMGIRGKIFRQVSFDVVAFDFQLYDAIVIQSAADGAEYFINSGETKQKGFESSLSWSNRKETFKVWSSYTYNHFNFGAYAQDGSDYSNNELTGVAPNIFIGGIDLILPNGLYANTTFNYTERIPLNDANSEYSSDFFLIGTKIGFRKSARKVKYDFFMGIDNALNQRYSLGNDLNAVGGRYYNAAPARNYFAGIRVQFFH